MEELGYKVDNDTLLFDAADRAVLGRQVFQLSVPIKAALTFASGSTSLCTLPRALGVRVDVRGRGLTCGGSAQGLRVVPLVLVVRVSAGVSARLSA